MTDASEDDKKREYALALLRHPDDPFKAAMAVFPGDAGKALVVSRDWPNDPIVTGTIEDIPEDQAEQMGVPSKNALAREAWRRIQMTNDHETAFKGIETVRKLLYPEEKGGTTVNNNTLVDNRKVMVVTDHGTNEEWEAKLRAQQARLVEDADRPAAVN